MFLNAVAASLNTTLSAAASRLEAELPIALFRGSRLQGFIPPAVAGPAFNIRKPPAVVYSLDDYCQAGMLTVASDAILGDAVVGA